MKYTAKEIAQICNGQIVAESPYTDEYIEYLAWDSRQLLPSPSTLFVAIKGKQHDAHRYINDIESKGIRFFLIEKGSPHLPKESKACFIEVKNTIQALQILARHHRSLFSIPILAITGSNGKTTVKEWISELLSPLFQICKSPKSYNSQLGVPISVLQLAKEHQLAIFETGISMPNEMQKLSKLLNANHALITNIGSAHDEGFADRKQKLKEKMELLKTAEVLFYSEEKPLISNYIDKHFPEKKKVSIGKSDKAYLQILNKELKRHETLLSFQWKKEEWHISIPFTGDAAIENASYCLLMYLYFRKDESNSAAVLQDFQYGVRQLSNLKMRLEVVDGLHQMSIVNDTYNNDLHSIEVALQYLVRDSTNTAKAVILSDLQQIKQEDKETIYNEIAEKTNRSNIETFIGIGQDIRLLKGKVNGTKSYFFDNKEVFKQQFDLRLLEKHRVLVKGARKYQFEDLVDFMAEKNHRTYLEIDLNALRNNITYYRDKLNPGTKLLVMVKAEAYGGGDTEIARLLESEHIDYLGVAYVDEGIKLRKAGIESPILVLNAAEHEFQNLIRFKLEPEIHSIPQFKAFAEVTKDKPFAYPIHLKIETGMNRLGLSEKELEDFIKIFSASKNIRIKSVFSHLASSEDKINDVFTISQFQRFEEACRQLKQQLKIDFDRHILNSAGIIRFPEHHYEMVRLGIGLYGIGYNENHQQELQLAFKLKSKVTAIHKVYAGESIGYGRMGKVQTDARIAIISIGYADGLLRKAGQGKFKLRIRDKYFPLIGNVCMDMCMVDLGQDDSIAVGDEVIIFEKPDDIYALSEALETIPYEVLTNISGRVRRKYVQD